MKKTRLRKLSSGLDFCVFTMPAFVLVLIATIIPFLMNMYYSLFSWSGTSKTMKFVGLQNFVRIFTKDAAFGKSALFTLKFAVFYVILVNVIAILLALALSKTGLFSSIGRSFYYIPQVISLVAIGLIWKFIFGPGFDSLYNLTGLNVFKMSWVGDPKLVFWSVLFISLWQNAGFYLVIYIAGIMAVPTDVLEAASIDGAGAFRKFFHMTFPLIMPSVTVCLLMSLTFAFKLFDIILVFTKGGPANASSTVAYNIYNEAFVNNKYGLATAKSLIFFVAVLLVTIVQLRLTKSKEVEA